MEEDRRRLYLSAMGVSVWEPRFGPGPGNVNALAASSLSAVNLLSPLEGDSRQVQASTGVAIEAGAPRPELGAAPMMDAESMDDGLPETRCATKVATMGWDDLVAAVAACRACGLCETRTQTVFGVGNRGAELMVIGEAPGADEDREGEPFVGRAGQLLTRMLAAIGLPREQVFIANVLKCRPPGNRDPKPEEIQHCEGFLMRQVDLVRPRAILAVGRISAQSLLRTDESIGRLRGRWFAFGQRSIPLRVTYHPAYLLRSPEQKAKAWEDLVVVRRRLNEMASEPAG